MKVKLKKSVKHVDLVLNILMTIAEIFKKYGVNN